MVRDDKPTGSATSPIEPLRTVDGARAITDIYVTPASRQTQTACGTLRLTVVSIGRFPQNPRLLKRQGVSAIWGAALRGFCLGRESAKLTQIPFVLELQQDLLHRFVDAQAGGIDRQFRFLGHFVRIGYAREFRDQAGACLGV